MVFMRLYAHHGALALPARTTHFAFHEFGQVERLEHGRKGVLIQGRIPGRLVAQFKPWQVKAERRKGAGRCSKG